MNKELPKGIQEAISKIENIKVMNPEIAKEILESVEISEEEMMPWADFEHSKEDCYGRVMVYDGGFYEFMVMSWNVGDMSAIHDHGFTQWGAVKLFGNAEHAVFQIDENNKMSTIERKFHEPGAILPVGHDLIHQMGNVGFPKYLTLHLYGCDGRDSLVTGNSKLYDFNENKIQITNGGVFFGLPECEITDRMPAPKPDFPTLVRFKVEYLNRLFFSLYSEEDIETSSENLNKDLEAKIIYELFSQDFWEILRAELDEMVGSPEKELLLYLESLSTELVVVAICQHNILEVMEDLNFDNFKEDLEKLLESLTQGELSEFTQSYLKLISEKLEINFKLD
ncbi:MAG: hypothetical protein DWQ06_09660 [Calditrichaeota bacterium]|nr:MAG: hypothetical protein DWQ06_09660 [Calditrichota bacterium]